MGRKRATKVSTASAAAASGFNWDMALKVVGSIVAVAGLLFGVYQYQAGREDKVAAEKAQREQQAAAEKAQKKSQYYAKATSLAAGFAQATTKAEADEKRKQFWELYLGELSIVEDENVKLAMQDFGGAIRQWEKYNTGDSDFSAPSMFELEAKDGSPQTFDKLAYQLSQACRESLDGPSQ